MVYEDREYGAGWAGATKAFSLGRETMVQVLLGSGRYMVFTPRQILFDSQSPRALRPMTVQPGAGAG
jgi:hypothetical protein